MNQSEIHFLWQHLRAAGVVQNDLHIILSNGLHTDTYANFVSASIPSKRREQMLSWALEQVTKIITEKTEGRKTVFLGIGCGYWYAAQLAQRLLASSVYAERSLSGAFGLRRDQGLVLDGSSVIIVDDVLTEGTTLIKLMALARAYGGTPTACIVLLNRSGQPFKDVDGVNVPLCAMYEETFPTWTEADCPMCKAGKPFSTQHGKGAEVFHLKGQPQAQKS
ncbi:MAG: phosphoribosyltransferase family protein [Patescibacteria group bacterium]